MQLTSRKTTSAKDKPPESAIARVQRLLRRKRSEKNKLEAEILKIQGEIAKVMARKDEFVALHSEIRDLFERASKLPRLRNKERMQVMQLLIMLQAQGTVMSELDSDSECDCPQCRYERGETDNPYADQSNERYTYDSYNAYNGGGDNDNDDAPWGPSRSSPSRAPKLRDLYRDLAFRFHPDRAADDEQRAHHESVMREVNDAYRGRDVDRLLKLGQEIGLNLDELRGADEMLQELIRQYEELKQEVRWLRRSLPGSMVVETRRAKRNHYPTPLEQISTDLDNQWIEGIGIRDCVQRFIDGSISLSKLIVELQRLDSNSYDDSFDDPFADWSDVDDDDAGDYDAGDYDADDGNDFEADIDDISDEMRRKFELLLQITAALMEEEAFSPPTQGKDKGKAKTRKRSGRSGKRKRKRGKR